MPPLPERSRPRCPRSVGVALLALLFVWIAGCGKKGLPAPQGGSDVPPSKVNLKRSVDLARVEQKSIVSFVESVGSIEAESVVQIPAGVAGIVDEVHFREGDLVDPDDERPLVQIDLEYYRALADIAENSVKENRSNLKVAEDELRRLNRLKAENSSAITQQEYAKAVETVASQQAKLLSSEASLKIARINLHRSSVQAPVRGQINQRMVTPKMRVKEDTVIGTMADMSRLRLVGNIPESAANMVRQRLNSRTQVAAARTLAVALSGTTPWAAFAGNLLAETGEVPAGYDPEFTIHALPNRLFRGGVFYMSTTGDPSTRMFEFKAEIDARTPGAALLFPGYSAKIRVPVQTNVDAMVIPEQSVRATERGFVVFEPVRQSNREGNSEWVARARRVEIGVRNPGWAEVRAGLSPRQWIVRYGAEALEDGTPLHITPEQQKLLEAGK